MSITAPRWGAGRHHGGQLQGVSMQGPSPRSRYTCSGSGPRSQVSTCPCGDHRPTWPMSLHARGLVPFLCSVMSCLVCSVTSCKAGDILNSQDNTWCTSMGYPEGAGQASFVKQR